MLRKETTMKVFFLSNGIWEYDGRLRELVQVSRMLGQTKLITRATKKQTSESHIRVVNKSFIFFILLSIYQALKEKEIDILFIDNRKAIIPAIAIRAIKRPRIVILDIRELYLPNEINHLQGKIGCFFESFMIKKSNIIISANKQRSKIMKDYYQLDEAPLIFENIRRIEYSQNYNEEYFKNKYKSFLQRSTCKVISTSGHSVSRTNDKLVEDMAKLGGNYELLLVGGGTNQDRNIIEDLIKKNSLSNVQLIDMVDTDELKFLIQNSDIGIVNYHQKDLNNKYCASGKIFEFLFEGIPIVTTENEPLKEICASYKVGVSSNNYSVAISEVFQKYDYYKKNALSFVEKIDVKKNNSNLSNAISKKIEGYINDSK